MGKIGRRGFLRGLSLAAAAAGPGAGMSRAARLARRAGGTLRDGSPLDGAGYFAALNGIGRVTGDRAIINLVTADDLDSLLQVHARWAETVEELPTTPFVSDPVLVDTPGTGVELVLNGLRPSTRYFYQVAFETDNAPNTPHVLPIGTFHTQRGLGEEFEIAILADAHLGSCFFDFDLATVWGFNTIACQDHLAKARETDLCVDLGDSTYPVSMCDPQDAWRYYSEYRRVMRPVYESMPVFYALGNHEQEAGFYQHGDDGSISFSSFGNQLSRIQYHQKWATHARLLFVPNPRGDTYPEGGEGAPGCDSSADWGAGNDPWNNGDRSHLQNFYAWSWGDALFVVLDPFRYTLPGGFRRPISPSEWRLGATQMAWLERTLAGSSARWKFLFAHHQVGGGLIDEYGNATEEWKALAYGRGSSVEADRPGTEQAGIHALMRSYGAQFFVYGHDHCFSHSVRDDVHYLACGRPTYINNWYHRAGMRGSYGNVLLEGADCPWIERFHTILGYTRFRIGPERVTMEWVRTGFSFQPNVIPCFALDFPQRDWMESWGGKPYPVDGNGVAAVSSIPTDVDGVRTLDGATVPGFYQAPAGQDYYVQPIPTRPETYDAALVPTSGYPPDHPAAVVDYVPESVYQRAWDLHDSAVPDLDARTPAPAQLPPLADLAVRPNPARAAAAVTFTARENLHGARLFVHDGEGRLLDCVPLGDLAPGPHSIRWLPTPATRRRAPHIVCLLSIHHAAGKSRALKVALVR